MKWIKSLLMTMSFLAGSRAFAQQAEMADAMRSSGKIYVVVAVMSIIFIGVAIYLYTIDKKVSKIEQQKKEQ